MFTISSTDVAVTGDRPTGPLHLGHYAGSIRNRLALQHQCRQTVLIADLQALTDNADDPGKISKNVVEVAFDYLACGIDPERSTICLQSDLPELAELTTLFLNLVSKSRLERNPTIRKESQSRGFGDSMPAGFLAYPVAQAADILGLGGTVVPVGDDQMPMIETTNHIARRLESMAGSPVVPGCRAMLSQSPRLPGIDGKGKASKSAGNAIALSDDPDTIRKKVMTMYTDPEHLRVEDPGRVVGNVVFDYLDAFDPDQEEVARLKAHYGRGGLGDMVLKRRLCDVLVALIAPIGERRAELSRDPQHVMTIVRQGGIEARETAADVLDAVRNVFGLSRRKRQGTA